MLNSHLPPRTIRLLFTLLCAFLMALSVPTIFNFFSAPTDENIFTNPPGALMVERPIAGSALISRGTRTADGMATASILPGDLLLAVAGKMVVHQSDVAEAFRGFQDASHLPVEVFRPSLGRTLEFNVSRPGIADSSVTELNSFVYVVNVSPGGASDRAGMRVGDLIVKINSRSFRNAEQADVILRRGEIGHAITYDILRDGSPMQLYVTLARFGAPIHVLLMWLCGMLYLSFGIFVAISRPHLPGARLIGRAFILVGFFLMMLLIRRDLDKTLLTNGRDLLVALSLTLGLATLAHSGAYFPRESPALLADRRRYLLGYAVAVAAGAASLFGDTAFFIALGVLVVHQTVLRIYHRKHWSAEVRKLSRPLMVAWILAVVCVPFSLIAGKTDHLPLAVSLNALLFAAVPLTYAYSIGRYRLLDLNLRIRRNIQYTLVSVAWGLVMAMIAINVLVYLPEIRVHLPTISISGTSVEVRDALPGDHQRDVQERLVLILTALLVWYGLWKLRQVGQRFIDRKYDRTRYDYRRARNELSEVLATKLGMVDLARGIVEILVRLMRLKQAGVLFFRDENACCCQAASGITDGVWSEICIRIDGEVIDALLTVRNEVGVEYLPARVKELFRQNGFQYVVPVRSKERLIGVLLLGEKLSEASFNQEDLEFLSSAAKQASVSIENAFLYEELTEKDHLKHELEIARRIQLASLPQHTPAIKGLEVAGVSLPAQEVGGDFYDYLDGTGEHLTIVVGDVSGKGTSAALYMSKVQGVLRSLHSFGLSPRELFIRANRLLCADLEKHSFVTAIGADFDSRTRRMTLARAGHVPLYWLRAGSGEVERIVPRGLGLGLNNAQLFSEEIEEQLLDYSAGDVMMFLTDGVLEVRNAEGEEFGEDRLSRLLQSHRAGSVELLRAALLEQIRTFAGDVAQHDDQTIVVVRCL